MTITPGQGGEDSQNFAKILLKMYSQYLYKYNMKLIVDNIKYTSKNGIKIAILKITGLFVYGYLKSEIGVHRLVRVSSTKKNNRRHTSFASVWVNPNFDKCNSNILSFKNIKIDTFKAKGAGGQHVNKTNSAVRATDLITRISVVCQTERSQWHNKSKALENLIKKIDLLNVKKYNNHKYFKEICKKNASFGAQIRNYILFPYYLVKDLRSNLYTYEIQLILNGNIKILLTSFIIWMNL
jgi:peptide chain release factor 2